MKKSPESVPDRHKPETPDLVIPRIEEELELQRRVHETGRVRISKSVHQDIQLVSEPITTHEVEVRRVPKDQILKEPLPTRQEGGVTIIPVMEEIVVITKQLVLREEIHLIPVEKTDHVRQEITLQKETVDIERLKIE